MVGWTPGFRLPASFKRKDGPMPKAKGTAKKTASMGKGGGDGKAKKGMKQSAAKKPSHKTKLPKKSLTGGVNPMTPAVAKAKAKKG